VDHVGVIGVGLGHEIEKAGKVYLCEVRRRGIYRAHLRSTLPPCGGLVHIAAVDKARAMVANHCAACERRIDLSEGHGSDPCVNAYPSHHSGKWAAS